VSDAVSKVAATESVDKAFVTTRTLDVSRDVVFKSWGEADRLLQWWGPKGLQLEICSLNFKPDGVFHYALYSPTAFDANGQSTGEAPAMWGRLVYGNIVPLQCITFTSGFSDETGAAARAPFSKDFPLEVLNTVTFEEEQSGKTKMTLCAIPFNATPAEQVLFEGMFDSMQQGFNGTWDQLAEYLAKS
jgi:uncharacterized protein YndB with AHSA1/START domain